MWDVIYKNMIFFFKILKCIGNIALCLTVFHRESLVLTFAILLIQTYMYTGTCTINF